MTTTTAPELDQARAEAFAERMLDALNAGALSVMISIGHRTGLLDALAGAGEATSDDLAAAAGLDERYVREWLGAMTTGRVVELDPATGRHRLPAEHAAWLTRAAAPDNLAVTAQYIPLLGAVEDAVVRCFHEGGGVPYGEFPRFHEVMAEDSDQTVVSALEGAILPLVDGLAGRLESRIDVLDLGCGRGHALLALAERFPRSRFTGADLSAQALEHARATAGGRRLTNVRFEERDLGTFDREAAPAAYDLVTTFDAVHDQGDPDALLRGIRRTLRPGGVFLMQDIAASSHVHENLDHPLGPLLYTVSTMHCMTVSLAQDGAGLGTMWGDQLAREMLAAAGFSRVESHLLEHDPVNAYYVVRA